jgi:hypothetical protein
MNLNALRPIFYSFIHPTQLIEIIRNLFNLTHRTYSNEQHLEASISWLCRSQDRWQGVSKDGLEDGGCSAFYGFYGIWAPPYPETTGYIISTFIQYANKFNDESIGERAKRMGDWEIKVQLPSGAVRGGVALTDYPIVFNTGMVILGLVELYKYSGNERYLSASKKAADWICRVMDNDGKWSKYDYNGIPHTYSSRVAWSLLEVYKLTDNLNYKESARKNIEWVLSNVQDNGWINGMGFNNGDEAPLTHTIAYTLRGLLESSFFFEDEFKLRIQKIVIASAEQIMNIYENCDGYPNISLKLLPGRINRFWKPAAKYSCLTGNAQISIIWLKIYKLKRDDRFLRSARLIIDQLKRVHSLKSINPGIRGGIAGSYPIWGQYMQFRYPNWAAKFFADALMLLEEVQQEKAI